MSRCEHGEQISLFCIHESCAWREAGGCNLCIKKNHLHAQNKDILELDEIEELNKLFYVRPEIKPKSEVLQEAVYNYFIIMKSQINASLDAVSRCITSKLSHPYLYSESFLNVFRKIKNKEYKKINRKELRKFSQFVHTQNVDIVEFNEKKLYKEEVAQLTFDINSINEVFHKYSKAIDKLDNSFNVEKSFLSKIIEISSTITGEKIQEETEDKISTQSYQSSGSSSQIVKEGHEVFINLPEDNKGVFNDKDKKIEYETETNENHLRKNKTEFYQRKKKQTDMENKHEEKILKPMGNTEVSLEKNSSFSRSAEKNTTYNLSMPNNATRKDTTKAINFKHFPHEKTILPIHEQDDEHRISQNNYKDDESKEQEKKLAFEQNIKEPGKEFQFESNEDKKVQEFEEIKSQGMNNSEMIAHTILPRVESKPKLYEDTKDVKERKITIPVKKFDEEEENFSPLLKRKRENKENRPSLFSEGGAEEKLMKELVLFNESTHNKDTINEDETKDEAMLMKDQEANSLALLIESLPLEADKAIPLLEAALKYAHNNLSAAEYLSYLYLETSRPKECLELCNQVLEQIEESPEVNELSLHINNNKAAALNLLGRYSESIGILEHCLTFTKKDMFYKNLGDSYFSISIYEKAILNYEKALEMNNGMDETYYNLAVVHFIQKHFHEAKISVSKAIKLSPRNEEYLLLRREIAVKLQN